MTVWGTELEIAIVLFVVAFPVALLFLTYHHYHSHGTFRGWSAVVTILTFMYVTGVIAFTLFPFPDQGRANCVAGESTVHGQFIPLASLGDIIDVWQSVGLLGMLTSVTFLQVALNVFLLVPLGMLLAYRYKRSFGFTVLVGLGVSLLIEVTQGTAIFGTFDCPYRLADVDDLIANTTGAALGWVIASILARWLPNPTPERHPDVARPRLVRRLYAGFLDVLTLILSGAIIRGIVLITLRPAAETLSESWAATTMTGLEITLVIVLLFLIAPLIRRDGATPGQIATWLASVDDSSLAPASARQTAVRFAVRWLPIALGAFVAPIATLAVVAAYETATVALRKDRRSLSDVAASTMTVTRRSLETTSDQPQQSER